MQSFYCRLEPFNNESFTFSVQLIGLFVSFCHLMSLFLLILKS